MRTAKKYVPLYIGLLKLAAAPFIVGIALSAGACLQRGVQQDTSLFGDSAIARRVLPETYTNRGEKTDHDLESWILDVCRITDRDSVMACGKKIGMDCQRIGDESECKFIGIHRARSVEYFFSPSLPTTAGPWGQGAAVVTLRYEEYGRINLSYAWLPDYRETER